MSKFFPVFLKLDSKKVLIVGGGKIAGDKLAHMLDFTDDITILSPKITDRIKELIDKHSLKYIQKEYQKGDIEGFFIVIIAVDDIKVQEEIFNESKERKILCNSVDSIDYCDFIYPSYIKRGDLTIAISTSGASPAFSKHFRLFLQKVIPQNVGEFLEEMRNIRKKVPKGKERMKMLDNMAKDFVDKYMRERK